MNELHLQRNRNGGGKLIGRFDDAAMFDAIATLVDAQAAPRTAEDDRTPTQRQAEALADACGWVLAHADTTALSSCGGRRPQVSVVVGLADLECRARDACLDFGGTLSPTSLRMLACDAAVVPVVLGGAGSRWTSGGPPAPSPTAYAVRSRSATAVAPGVGARPRGARCITSCRGSGVGRPRSPTWSCCAGSATGWSTTPAGTCA